MSQIFYHYYNEETATGLEFHLHSELPLPAITVCNDYGFKEKAASTSEQAYLNATYRFEPKFRHVNDMIYIPDFDDSREELFPTDSANDNWTVSLTVSYVMGRCYTFRMSEPSKGSPKCHGITQCRMIYVNRAREK